jgi:hypothetical protein
MVAPQEEGKGQEPTQPEGETGKVPKKGMGAGKKWLIFLSIGIVVAAVVVGIGFIPKTVSYSCTTTEYYDCYQTEEYSCQEAYTCYEDEPYTSTSTVDLTYTQYSSSANEHFWDCDISVYTNVRNTDSVGGYFDVEFHVVIDGSTRTSTQTKWISAGNTLEFSELFPMSCGGSWSWSTPTVDPPTKAVQQIGTHSVEHTCYRAGTCQRDVLVPNGCSQDVSGTCSYQDRLFW